MELEEIRAYCLSFPHAVEDIKWGHDLVFLIGGKMFTVLNLDLSSQHLLSFKCAPETFVELIERNGVIPAPYAARYHWVTLERYDALKPAELKALIKNSFEIVFAKLSKKVKSQLGRPIAEGPRPRAKPRK
ncbi:MAG: MmcQ/YjbR family DNA-binding protein [candidate division Zixibacteria bacterium]|nr:MmcQ/YjbR family DNA-binding protein [candidate division Zixibacteria bacterium]